VNRSVRITVLTIVLLALAIVWARQYFAPDDRFAPLRLSGIVEDEREMPISGALVYGELYDGSRVEVRTDEAGRFTFERAPYGLDFTISAPGFARRHIDADRSDVRIQLKEASVISGRVTADGAPISGVTVVAYVESMTSTTTSDAGGRFAFPDRGSGMVQIDAYSPDWAAIRRQVVHLESGETIATLEIPLRRATWMGGTISWDGHCSKPALTVRNGEVWRRVRAKRDGRVRVNGLLPGRYVIEADCDAYRGPYSMVLASGPTTIDIGDEPAPDRRWMMRRRPTLHVQVLAADGKPARGQRVIVEALDDVHVSSQDTSLGWGAHPLIEAAGPHVVRVVSQRRLETLSSTVVTLKWHGNSHIVLKGGEHPTAHLSGIVVDARDQPVEGLTVSVDMKKARTDATGRFNIHFLEPGAATVRVWRNPFEGALPLGRAGGSSISIELGPNKPVQLNLEVPTFDQRLTGVVLDHEGSPVEGAEIVALLGEGPFPPANVNIVPTVRTNPRGEFTIERAPAMPHRIRASRDSLFAIEAGRSGKSVTLRLPAPATISGRVTKIDPEEPVWVATSSEWDPIPAESVAVAGDGSFIFVTMPGRRELFAFSEKGAAARTITLAPGREAKVDLELAPWTKIRGRVIGSDGKPAPLTAVALDSAVLGESTRTNSRGEFEIEHALPGAHTLIASPTFGADAGCHVQLAIEVPKASVLELPAVTLPCQIAFDHR
jgi:hypothetical protein